MPKQRTQFETSQERALSLLAAAPAVQLSGVDQVTGRPLVRTFSSVLVDGRLCFHGGDGGAKRALIGSPVVVSWHEVVAQVASHWIHPELACPASTYYRSVLAEGTTRVVESRAQRARILTALLERHQPEGGYLPLGDGEGRYRGVIDALLVVELEIDRISGNEKLGQHRTGSEICGVLEGLWARGQPGDLAAMRAIFEAHPAHPRPAVLTGPCDTTLCVAPDAVDAQAASALLSGRYWTRSFSPDELSRAHLGSAAWIVARSAGGEVVGSARAVADGGRFAHIMDVVVAEPFQRRGLGKVLMQRLLDHPALRGIRQVSLATRDATSFYEPFGFIRHRLPDEIVPMRLSR